MTAMYVLFGFIYTFIGVPMIFFGNRKLQIVGTIYSLMPLFMGIFGFIFFVIFAAVYNALAKRIGGVEVEIKNIETA
jgi:hypothetical protein